MGRGLAAVDREAVTRLQESAQRILSDDADEAAGAGVLDAALASVLPALHFPEPWPVQTTVGAALLGGAKVEITALAVGQRNRERRPRSSRTAHPLRAVPHAAAGRRSRADRSGARPCPTRPWSRSGTRP